MVLELLKQQGMMLVEDRTAKLEVVNGVSPDSPLRLDTALSDPIRWEQAYYRRQDVKYAVPFAEVFGQLDSVHFEQPQVDRFFHDNVDRGLILKQIAHLFTAAECFGGANQHHVDFAVDYALASIIPIQVTDTFIDYSRSPHLTADMMAREDVRTAWLFTNACMNMGFQRMVSASYPRQVAEVVSEVFRDVPQAMADCYYRRYDPRKLDHVEEELAFYEQSPISRLLGSGFYQICVDAACAIANEPITPQLRYLTQDMRRLRQLVDEIADWREDVVSGELTLPFLYLLEDPEMGGEAKQLIQQVWTRAQNIIVQPQSQEETIHSLNDDPEILSRTDGIKELLMESGSFDRLYNRADAHWINTVLQMGTVFQGKNYYDLLLGVHLRREFLERLKKQDWEDVHHGVNYKT